MRCESERESGENRSSWGEDWGHWNRGVLGGETGGNVNIWFSRRLLARRWRVMWGKAEQSGWGSRWGGWAGSPAWVIQCSGMVVAGRQGDKERQKTEPETLAISRTDQSPSKWQKLPSWRIGNPRNVENTRRHKRTRCNTKLRWPITKVG